MFFGRIKDVPVSTRSVPISDGGTGFRRVLTSDFTRGETIGLEVEHPHSGVLNSPISILDNRTAIIESADFIGLARIPQSARNPLHTTSKPLGEAIKFAIDRGCDRILIGGGDSATCDGGVGLLAGLGARIFDTHGEEIATPKGKDLGRIGSIDLSSCTLAGFQGELVIAANLTSVALGNNGTARVYAGQKGASPEEVEVLACGMDHYAEILESLSHRSNVGKLPGSGSAGGISYPLMQLAERCAVKYSFEVTFPALDLESHLSWADIVLTGEGLFDRNSIKGKAPVALALMSKQYDCRTIGIVGAIEQGIVSRLIRSGLDAIEPLTHQSISLHALVDNAERLISEATTRALMKLVQP